MRRLTVSDIELEVIAEALREALAADLLSPDSRTTAAELLDRVDAKLPAATAHHPAGSSAGRLLAADEILRLLVGREQRDGHAALTNEAIARELAWKPAGTSIRQLLEELRRGGWLTRAGRGAERRFALTGKGRGRARALQHAGGAPDDAARVSAPDDLLDLIYADSTPCAIAFGDDREQQIAAIWHRPTVLAAARLDATRLDALETVLRDRGSLGAAIHSYGTLTPAGEQHARERWQSSRPAGGSGRPPRLARPYKRAGSVIARAHDRACPNCGAQAGWLTRRRSKRWDELHGRGEVDYTCPYCAVRWTIYLEATGADGTFDPRGDPRLCRPRWRYRDGWLRGDALAPTDHHPTLTGT